MEKETTLKDVVEKLEELRHQEFMNEPSSYLASIESTLEQILEELKAIRESCDK